MGIANTRLGRPTEVEDGQDLLYPDSSDFGIIDEVNHSLWETTIGYVAGRGVTSWFRNRRTVNR